ncbi:MAG: leucyl aminopeptidase [Pseudobdellovibrionaceae bacterium]
MKTIKIELKNLNITAEPQDAIVVFATTSAGKADKSGKKADPKISVKNAGPQVQEFLKNSLADGSISGKSGDVVTYREAKISGARHLVVVGMGDDKKMDHEAVRQSLPGVLGALSALKAKKSTIVLETLAPSKSDLASFVKAAAEGALLGNYSFDELKSSAKKEKTEDTIYLAVKTAADAKAKNALAEAIVLSECVNFSRRLGDMPGNLMTPSILADETTAAAKGTKIKVTVWDKARIKKEKMGGLLGVSQGSDQEPRFIVMEYNGGAKSKKPVAFVGKGLTFDCGGISIKPSAAMEEMKYDMCGGANVIGAVLAIAKMKLKVNVIGIVPATENLVNGSATKPGDVHTARNGKTFEVNNTDAEGRLILADALCYASEQKPQLIVDAATLTGAMVVALGNIHTGYFTRNAALKNKIEKAAAISGEWVWNMPLTDFHVKDMKGTFADLSNISASKGAGSATAAAFLEQFVDADIPWVHFDIAGTAWAAGNRLNYCPKKGASGAMVRTFVEIARMS